MYIKKIRKVGSLVKEIKRYRNAYIFISPFYILFMIFGAFPILYSFYLSFHQWRGFGPRDFVGLRNYINLLNDELFWVSLKNTAYMWLGHIFIMLLLALALAIVLNSATLRMKGFYRMTFYLPTCIAIVAVALVFGVIYDTEYGVLNYVLNKIGIFRIPWIASSKWSKNAIIILNIWRVTGWYMVILLAGLQTINTQLYEAAEIDGANALQRTWHITIPALKPIFFFCFIIETIGSFRIFTEPYVLTHGGPANSSISMTLYLYNTAFQYFKFGYASAISFGLFGFVVMASWAQLRIWGRKSLG